MNVARAIVSKPVTLGMAPQRFHGIQVRRIAGQVFEKHIAAPRGPAFHKLRTMRLQIIKKHNHRPADMTSHLLKKLSHLPATDRFFRMQLDISRKSPQARRNRHCSDRRDLAGVPGAMDQLWRVTHRGPRSPHVRRQQQAAFIDEYDVGVVTACFFLIRDQSRAIQRLTLSGSRSRGCNCGFWQLNPSARSKQER